MPPNLSRCPVHPHAGGEHLDFAMPMRLVAGSPPRRWGTRGTGRATAPTPRFTPTQVGNTSMTDRERAVSAVHPHAGGEHCLSCAELRPRGGSPPRRWGTQAGRYTPKTALRFTPTQVGNTHHGRDKLGESAVHPHAGGEHTSKVDALRPLNRLQVWITDAWSSISILPILSLSFPRHPKTQFQSLVRNACCKS